MANKKKFQKKSASILGQQNLILLGVAAVVILIGYWTLAQEPVDGFASLTIAPILLVIGYCLIIPYAIMKSHKGER